MLKRRYTQTRQVAAIWLKNRCCLWSASKNGVVRTLLDEINNRNISSSEISTQEEAMQKACNLIQQGHVVSHVAGPNGERIDIVDIRKWCSAHER